MSRGSPKLGRRQGGFWNIVVGVGLALYSQHRRDKASRRMEGTYRRLGDERLALSREMANWYKAQSERNWEAARPARELGHKALGAIDANMESGRYGARASAPPRSDTASTLPVWGRANSGVRPPGYSIPERGPSRWPDQAKVPENAPLPSG